MPSPSACGAQHYDRLTEDQLCPCRGIRTGAHYCKPGEQHIKNYGGKMNSIKTLETSIIWQNHVLNNARNEAQKERARHAIEVLQKQLNQLKAKK